MGLKFQDTKGILLDLDNTLYPYEECNECAKKALFSFLEQKIGVTTEEVEMHFDKARIDTQQSLAGTAGAFSRTLYIKKCVEQLLGKGNYELVQEAEKFYWNAFLALAKLREGAKEFLEEARKRGLKTAIISDFVTHVQMDKISHFKIGNLINFLITSEEAGKNKPDPRMFNLALSKLKLRPDEAVMIGDDFDKDILGARRVGIPAIYFVADGSKPAIEDPDIVCVDSFKKLHHILFLSS